MEKCKYKRIDKDHNTYQCTECGHILTFEADGPFENSTDFCPKCGKQIDHNPFVCECGFDGKPAPIRYHIPANHFAPMVHQAICLDGLVVCPDCRRVYFFGEDMK